MTRDDILEIVREASYPDALFRQYVGNADCGLLIKDEHLERFAALVIKAERERIIAKNKQEIERVNAYIKTLEESIIIEREACALVCEEFYSIEGIAQKCAAAIRARSQT